MKHLRLFAGVGVGFLLAACVGSSDESTAGQAMVVEADGLTTLPTAAAAAVKATAGLDATRGRPLYEPDGEAPAFFEAETSAGWAIVTADAAARVVEYGTSGRGPTARLDLGARAAMKRIYRLDAAVYIAADDKGNAVGRTTKSLLKLDRTGERATFVAVSSDEALKGWRAARNELLAANARAGVSTMADSPLFGGTAPAKTCAVKGDVPSYSQLGAGEGPNDTACASGCGPTAWATVFGWASRRAAVDTANAPFAGLFPNAPLTMNGAVGELSMEEINRVVGTFCADTGGATTTWSMGYVERWVAARAPGVQIDAHYNILMMPDNVVRDAVIDAVCDGRPSIVGTGSLFGGDGHYPIAKGYSNGRFELEMGWGGSGNGWYEAKSWYAGTIRH